MCSCVSASPTPSSPGLADSFAVSPSISLYLPLSPGISQEAREAMDAIDAFEVRLSGGGAPARNAVLASGGQKRSSPPSALSGKMTGRDYVASAVKSSSKNQEQEEKSSERRAVSELDRFAGSPASP